MKTKRTFYAAFLVLASFLTHAATLGGHGKTKLTGLNNAPFEGVPFKLILVDADTNTDLIEIFDGFEIDIDHIRNKNLNIRVQLDAEEQQEAIIRFDFKLTGPINLERSEFIAPYAAFGDLGGDFNGQIFIEGNYTLFVGINDGLLIDYWDTQEINFSIGNFEQRFLGLDLINAAYNQYSNPIEDGSTISYVYNPIIIKANSATFKIGSAFFELSGPVNYTRVENEEPFSLFGDVDSNYNAKTLPEGTYSLTVTPYSEANKKGKKGLPLTITFNVEFIKGDFLISVATMVDADTKNTLASLFTFNKTQIDKAYIDTNNVNILVEPSTEFIKSVYLALQGPADNFNSFVWPSHTMTENVLPFALFGDLNGDLNGKSLAVGNYQLTATPYTGINGTGKAGYGQRFEFEIIDTSVTEKTIGQGLIGPVNIGAQVFPNPAFGSTTIKVADGARDWKVTVVDVYGKNIRTYSDIGSPEKTIDLGDLPKGIYFVQINEGNTTTTKKLIVQ